MAKKTVTKPDWIDAQTVYSTLIMCSEYLMEARTRFATLGKELEGVQKLAARAAVYPVEKLHHAINKAMEDMESTYAVKAQKPEEQKLWAGSTDF